MVGLLEGGTVGSLTGTIQSPVFKHFLPVNTIRPLYFTVQSIFVKVTSHPALHSFTTESSEWEASPGMIWPSLAFVGSRGKSRSQVCVEDTYPPSGNRTFNGLVVNCLFLVGAAETKK